MIEITTRCNQKCRLCVRRHPEPIVDLSLDFLNKLSKYPFEYVSFNGARCEPTLHPYFLEILSLFPVVHLYSNATTHDGKWWSELAKNFPNMRLLFPIDLEKHWLRYRQVATWDKMVYNVKRFTDAGGIAGGHIIMFKHNQDDIQETEQLATELGCKRIRIKKSHSYDSVCEKPNSPAPEKSYKTIQCIHLNYQEIVVSAEGVITPCCFTALHPSNRERVKRTDWKQLLKYTSCEKRGELSTVEKALDSDLFRYLLDNRETSKFCNAHCKLDACDKFIDERTL